MVNELGEMLSVSLKLILLIPFLLVFIMGIFSQIVVMIGIVHHDKDINSWIQISASDLLEALLSRKYIDDKALYKWIIIMRICIVLLIIMIIVGSILYS